MSAISELLQILKKSVTTVGLEWERVCPPRIESKMVQPEKRQKNSINESITVEDLLVLEVLLDEFRV